MRTKNNHRNLWPDSAVEKHWDKAAAIYVSENDKVKDAHDQRFAESMKHLQLFNQCRVLNVTSRDCEANDYIIKTQPDALVVNSEISSGLMEVAKRIRPYVHQVKIETYSKLPFGDEEFDRVLSLETLEHVADPVAFLKELYRISIPKARLVVSCPPATSEIPYQMFTCLFGGHGEGLHRFLPSKEVKQMFEETGWELLFHKGTVLFPAGPQKLQQAAEKIIEKFQGTFISELGIRQFYVCQKY